MGILVGDRCFFELNTTDYESVGRTFESCGAHHFFQLLAGNLLLLAGGSTGQVGPLQ